MPRIRVWDTSALLQVFDDRQPSHRKAADLHHGPRARGMNQTISALVAVEMLHRIYRQAPQSAGQFKAILDDLNVVPLDDRVVQTAEHLAKRASRGVSGADVAIVATAIAVRRAEAHDVELVTADKAQAQLARDDGLPVVLI